MSDTEGPINVCTPKDNDNEIIKVDFKKATKYNPITHLFQTSNRLDWSK